MKPFHHNNEPLFSIGVIFCLVLQSQYETEQRVIQQHQEQHEDVFRSNRQQNPSGKLLLITKSLLK